MNGIGVLLSVKGLGPGECATGCYEPLLSAIRVLRFASVARTQINHTAIPERFKPRTQYVLEIRESCGLRLSIWLKNQEVLCFELRPGVRSRPAPPRPNQREIASIR